MKTQGVQRAAYGTDAGQMIRFKVINGPRRPPSRPPVPLPPVPGTPFTPRNTAPRKQATIKKQKKKATNQRRRAGEGMNNTTPELAAFQVRGHFRRNKEVNLEITQLFVAPTCQQTVQQVRTSHGILPRTDAD